MTIHNLFWKAPLSLTWTREKWVLLLIDLFEISGVIQYTIQLTGSFFAGNCWLLSAESVLITKKELFDKVVPANQNFKRGEYAGWCLVEFLLDKYSSPASSIAENCIKFLLREYIWHYGDNNNGVTTRGRILCHVHFNPIIIVSIVPY